MALIVEDGSLVTGANSFVAISDVTAYLADRGITTLWTAIGVPAQTTAVIQAGDYLRNENRYMYRGTRISYLQGMPWPRNGVTMFRGPALPNNVIPQLIKDAQCELCYRAVTLAGQLQPDLARGGMVQIEKVDTIMQQYFAGANPETVYSVVEGFLLSFLVSKGIVGLVPDVYQSDAQSLTDDNGNSLTTPFDPSDFRYPIGVNPNIEP